MNTSQQKFLVEAKNHATKKCHTTDIEKITNLRLCIHQIDGFSDSNRNVVAEQLLQQGLILEDRRKGGKIYYFKLTPNGLAELSEGLRTAGKEVYSVNIEISEQIISAVNKIVEEIKLSNIENKEVWIELSESLREEVAKEKPRKNVLALLLGAILKGVNVSSDISTIVTAAGVKPTDIITFVNGLFK